MTYYTITWTNVIFKDGCNKKVAICGPEGKWLAFFKVKLIRNLLHLKLKQEWWHLRCQNMSYFPPKKDIKQSGKLFPARHQWSITWTPKGSPPNSSSSLSRRLRSPPKMTLTSEGSSSHKYLKQNLSCLRRSSEWSWKQQKRFLDLIVIHCILFWITSVCFPNLCAMVLANGKTFPRTIK